MIKGIVIFAVGALIGAGTTVLIMRKKYDEKYNKLLEEAIESDADFKLREANRKLAEIKARESGYIQSSGEDKPKSDSEKGKLNTIAGINPNTYHETKDDVSGMIGKQPFVDYTSYYDSKAENEHPGDEYDLAARQALYEGARANEEAHEKADLCEVIIREEFNAPEFEYIPKSTLYFYKEDQVLATEDDQVILDPPLLIGNALDYENFRNNEELVIYVRNHRLGIDYQVEKIFNAYKDAKG